MKIVISSLTYPLPNGVTTSINTSVDGFIKEGHKVIVVAPDYGKGKIRPEHYPVTSSLWARMLTRLFHKEERMFALSARKQIEKIVKEFQPDAYWLHTVNWSASVFEKIMVSSDRVKVLTYHTLVEQYGRVYAGEIGANRMIWRSKALGNQMDAVITPSEMIKNKLRQYGVTKPVQVIPTGVNLPGQHFSRQEIAQKFDFSPEAAVLLYVGRVSKEKNISELIVMASQLKKMTDKFVLLLVGPGDIDETHRLAAQLGVAQQLRCSGGLPKEEAQKIYAACDLFVFASQTETQGLVINEAMAAGLPVVALDSPIQNEVYPDDQAVVVRNKEEFAASVYRLLNDSQRRQELSEKGKQFVEKNFSTKGMIEKQIGLISALLGS